VAENSLFQPQKSLLGMMPASKPRKDSVDQNANPTGGILSLVKTPSNISKQTTNAPTDAGQTPTNQTSQKKSMMQMIKERNSTFTEKSSSKKFK
jgi:hypothetical protein